MRPVLAVVLWLSYTAASTSDSCSRGLGTPKIPGDNGFSVSISGNPVNYVPEASYTITIRGMKVNYAAQKFVGFLVMVERIEPDQQLDIRSAGIFQLPSDGSARFSDVCPNAVTNANSSPKTTVEVTWTAPPAGSGCVQFRAMVHEYREMWYMDDGQLTKTICEEKIVSSYVPIWIKDCCACDEAKYEVTFQGLWNRHTHPKDFPKDLWTTHFSDIIGASHNPNYTMWEPGGNATDGLREVAEKGYTRVMESEMKEQSDNIRTIIKARGLWYPNLNGSTFAVFRVDRRHHLMSLVSMLGPSPDWIVGVSNMELCLDNCTWASQVVQELHPFDAGTDSGVTYVSDNQPSYPKGKIRQITSSFPNDPQSPFYDPSGESLKPVAKLTVTRQRLYEKSCSVEPLPGGTRFNDYEDYSEPDDRPECGTSEWTKWTPCSSSCGKGFQMRGRYFIDPMKAEMMGCKSELQQKDMCMGKCMGGNGNGNGNGNMNKPKECATTPWTEWSDCSASCGKGTRTRTRHYVDPQHRKSCFTPTIDRQECMIIRDCNGFPTENPECATTRWSEWSPCNATCGPGVQVRTRFFLLGTKPPHCTTELSQEVPCRSPDCVDITPDVCFQEKVTGPCRGHYPRWYYEPMKRMCMPFIYGGCRGNKNNFENHEECKKLCGMMKLPIDTEDIHSNGGGIHSQSLNSINQMGPKTMVTEPPIDCMMSEWSEWSPCSGTCGRQGRKSRQRMIKRDPENGGKACPKKVVQKRKCQLKNCSNETGRERRGRIDPSQCDRLGHWGPWSECSKTCGTPGIQRRQRVFSTERNYYDLEDANCDSVERRHCSVPPC